MPKQKWSRNRTVLLAALALALGVTAACSSSGDNSGDGTSSSQPAGTGGSASSGGGGTGAATGSTLKIGMQVPSHAVVDYSESVAAVKGAMRAINASGGINGHKLKLDFCNTALDPNKEQACARKLVADKVVATVGNANYTAEAADNSLFAKAGIPQVGSYPDGQAEKDPNSFIFQGGQTYANAAQIKGAVTYVGKRVALARLDFPTTTTYPTFYRKACETLGCTYAGESIIPSNSVTDFAPYAQALLNLHPDVIVPDLGPLIIPLMKALQGLGYKGKIVAQDTNFTTKNFLAQPQDIQDMYIVSTPFPPTFSAENFPGIKQYVTEMAAEKASGDHEAPTYTNFSQTHTMEAWLGMHVLATVANKAKASDSKTIKAALEAAKDVDTGNVIPPWTSSQSFFSGLPRVSTDAWYYYTLVGGKPKLLSTTPATVTDIVKAAYVEH